jgi:hypothetical protein
MKKERLVNGWTTFDFNIVQGARPVFVLTLQVHDQKLYVEILNRCRPSIERLKCQLFLTLFRTLDPEGPKK